MKEKGHIVLFRPRCNLDIGHQMASVYVRFYPDTMNHCISVQNIASRLPKCA